MPDITELKNAHKRIAAVLFWQNNQGMLSSVLTIDKAVAELEAFHSTF